jgi:hypothetical protein
MRPKVPCLTTTLDLYLSKIERNGTHVTNESLLAVTQEPEPHIIYNDDDLVFLNLLTKERLASIPGVWVGLDACDKLVFAMEYKTETLVIRILLHIFSSTGVSLAVFQLETIPRSTRPVMWYNFQVSHKNKWVCVHFSNQLVYHVHLFCGDPLVYGPSSRLLVEKTVACMCNMRRRLHVCVT